MYTLFWLQKKNIFFLQTHMVMKSRTCNIIYTQTTEVHNIKPILTHLRQCSYFVIVLHACISAFVLRYAFSRVTYTVVNKMKWLWYSMFCCVYVFVQVSYDSSQKRSQKVADFHIGVISRRRVNTNYYHACGCYCSIHLQPLPTMWKCFNIDSWHGSEARSAFGHYVDVCGG